MMPDPARMLVLAVRFVLPLAALLALPLTSRSDAYPAGPIRMLVPYPPGGSSDVIVRPLAPALSARLGQQVVVDNRGGGNIAMEIAAKAAPDGYTLVFALAAQVASNVSLFRNLPYDPVRDYAPISLLGAAPYLLEVNAAVPASSVAEFIALAKAKPGQINYWSSGNGSAALRARSSTA